MGYNALRVRRGLWLRVTMILAAMGEHRNRRDNREQDATQNEKSNTIARSDLSYTRDQLQWLCHSFFPHFIEFTGSILEDDAATMYKKRQELSVFKQQRRGGDLFTPAS
jgi:hypothetical protein